MSENYDEDLNKNKQIDENYSREVFEALRAEIFELKEWKSRATQEIVERDRALADLEHELVKQQSELDSNNEECTGHQRVIQELKSQLDQVLIYLVCTGMVFSKRNEITHQIHIPKFEEHTA